MADIMDGTIDKTAGDFTPRVYGQFVTREAFQTGVQPIINEDAIHVTALAPHVIHTVAIPGKRTIPHVGVRIPENRQDPVVRKRPLARLLRHRILARIRNVAYEQTVGDARGASGQEVNRRSGALRPVSQKHTVLNQDRALVESLLLDGDAGATRAGKV